MTEATIKALLMFDTVIDNGVRVVQIPLEDILRERVTITVDTSVSTVGDLNIKGLDLEPASPFEKELETVQVPMEIIRLYPTDKKEQMTQDVVDYLKIIAQCWEYHNLGFKPSILKKAAGFKPNLNTAIFAAYGKDGDSYLTQLVNENMMFIRDVWRQS